MQRMSMESQQQMSGLPEAAVISTGLAQGQVSQLDSCWILGKGQLVFLRF